MTLKHLLDEAAQLAVEKSCGPSSYSGTATAIAISERANDPWRPSADTPQALVQAVAAARKKPAVIAQRQREKTHLRNQVRNVKIRVDTENEINGTSYEYPSWVANYLKDNEID
ncbi:MAG: hypothetical protein PGN20_01695 [Agrobacterium cavarae]